MIRQYFYNRMLRNNMPKEPRQKQLCSFDTAHHVGILFTTADPDWKQEMSSILNYLRTKRIRYTALGYLAQHNISEDDCLSVCQYFSSKDVTWMRTPKQHTLAYKFMLQQFDMLINCASAETDILQYIMHVSPTNFKIGTKHGSMRTAPYDLMLDLPERNGIRPFFDVLKVYLPMLCPDNSKPEKTIV